MSMASVGKDSDPTHNFNQVSISRFTAFVLFMVFIFIFALIQPINDFNKYHDELLKMALITVISIVVLVPCTYIFSSMSKDEVKTTRARILLAVICATLLLLVPHLFGWTSFAKQNYWMQIPGEVMFLCFAPIGIMIRIRQGYWPSNSKRKD